MKICVFLLKNRINIVSVSIIENIIMRRDYYTNWKFFTEITYAVLLLIIGSLCNGFNINILSSIIF